MNSFNSIGMLKGSNMYRKLINTLLIVLSVFSINNYVYAESSAVKLDTQPLTIGLLPHLNIKVLLKVYGPLIKYLEQTLQRKVVVATGPNFHEYYKSSSQGKYDLYLTAPHHAAYAELHDKALRLAKFSRPLYSVFLVNKNSRFQTIDDLRGSVIATPDHLSVIAIVGELTLVQHGLSLKDDVTIKYSDTHSNAMTLVAVNAVDAAIVGVSAFDKMNKKVTKKLRILTKSNVIPHMMFMAKSEMPSTEYQKIKKVILDFNAKGKGKKFFSDSVFGDMQGITDDDMQKLIPLTSILSDRL